MAIYVIGLTQSMTLHIIDCVLYLTNIIKEIEWVQFDWTYSIPDVFGLVLFEFGFCLNLDT